MRRRVFVRSVRSSSGHVHGWAVLAPTSECRCCWYEHAYVGSWEKAIRIADRITHTGQEAA